MDPGVIDEMHVIDTRRTGCHASETGQAAVDMGDHFFVGWPVVLQHVLDQVDAAPRAVELVAERHIGRTGRGAEAAMDAFAQDLLGFGDTGILKLLGCEIGLHACVLCCRRRTVPDRRL